MLAMHALSKQNQKEHESAYTGKDHVVAFGMNLGSCF